MTVIGLDPGPEESALVGSDGTRILYSHHTKNEDILSFLSARLGKSTFVLEPITLVLEQIESFGMPVGREVFTTVFWAGRFAQAWSPRPWAQVSRRAVKLHLCGHTRATDANIRQALLDRFGPGREHAIGTRMHPGPLYGLKGHKWAAIAVALTYWDQQQVAKGGVA